MRWEDLVWQAAEPGFILRVLGLPEGVRQAMAWRGDRDTTLACEGGLAGVMSQLSEEARAGAWPSPPAQFLRAGFLSEDDIKREREDEKA